MTSTGPTPDRIMQLINGYWATGLLGAAASHSLFTHLDGGARTAQDVAQRAGVSERGAQTLLDGLVSFGLVERDDGGYRNAPDTAAFLVDGRPESLAAFAKLKLGHAGLGELPDVVRAGGPLADVVVEVADNPHWKGIVTAMAAQSVPVAPIAAEAVGLAEAGPVSILDVGGGSGIYSLSWLEINPQARATQLDWAPINDIARENVAERGLADRFDTIDGDFHSTDLAAGAYDVIVYSHIAHQEGPEDNTAVFGKLRAALKPGGALVVSDYIVEDDRGGPAFALLFASEMLLKSKHGGTWRKADYAAWLTKAGFEDVTFHATATTATLVVAR
jgi:SAM-dependent methyltransferase